MTRPPQPPVSDDSGASLTFALIIITVFSVIVAVVLSFADSSLRNTVALRAQATESASADGAGQIAVNELRKGTYDGTGACFGGSNTLLLPDFYQPPIGAADSAAVTCDADPPHNAVSLVEINDANHPANALLTLSTGLEAGVQVNVADGRDLKVHGSVFANAGIDVPAGGLSADAGVTALGACVGLVIAIPPRVCDVGSSTDPRGQDPDYPLPTASTAAQVIAACGTADQLVTFTPGTYTNVNTLNNMTRCPNSIFYFPPGTYYFNFSTNDAWEIDDGYLVGGTPTSTLVAGRAPTMPGSCKSPFPPTPAGSWTAPDPGEGVQFVFGGTSRLLLVGTRAEICGNYSTTAPPIALYGLKTAVGTTPDVVPAQSGCTVSLDPLLGCAVIKTDNSPNSRFYVQGTAYLPRSAVDIALVNPGGLMFSAGLVVRTLRVTPTSGAGLGDPVIAIPDNAPLGRRTVVYLNVYLCPGASTCSAATGTNRLRAKVGLLDLSGTAVAGARQVTVYSWSVLR